MLLSPEYLFEKNCKGKTLEELEIEKENTLQSIKETELWIKQLNASGMCCEPDPELSLKYQHKLLNLINTEIEKLKKESK